MSISNKIMAVTATAVLLIFGSGIAFAAIPSADGTIVACRQASGNIRVIDYEAGQRCIKKTETQIQWNVKGEPGTNGTNGQDGADGVSGYEIVTKDVELNSFVSGNQTLSCPEGKNVISGGIAFLVDGTGEGSSGALSFNGFPLDESTWSFGYEYDSDNSNTMRLKIICVTAL